MLTTNLTSVTELKKLFSKYNITPNKSLGQNFLICPEVIEATLAILEKNTKNITELGSGVGTLTQGLISKEYKVKAIEKDDEFIQILPKIIPKKHKDNLQIIHDDLKHADWSWQEPWQLVGNIPYNLSGLIIRLLTQLDSPPIQTVLLVQKEVGQRLRATPPNMSLLSLAVCLWGKAELLLNVPPNCFWPQPKVYSQLILLTPTKNSTINKAEREEILKTAKIFFQQKRKQIGGVLKKSSQLSVDKQEELLASASIKPEARPQELSITQWQKLSSLID